jgi:hypothetical protein
LLQAIGYDQLLNKYPTFPEAITEFHSVTKPVAQVRCPCILSS